MTLAFLGLGTTEVLVIVAAVFLLFGVDKLPEAARALGRARAELDRARTKVMNEISLADMGVTPAQVVEERQREKQMRDQSFEERRIVRAAEALGIDPQGKSTDALRAEINARVGGGVEEVPRKPGPSRWPHPPGEAPPSDGSGGDSGTGAAKDDPVKDS